MTKLQESIGEQIKSLRTKRKLTQRQLAKIADMRYATISDVENGKANIKLDTLQAIAKALRVELQIILT